MKNVFITGATGVMGKAALDAVLARGDCKVRILVRDSRKNRKLLKPYLGRRDVTVVWGDLLDARAVSRALGDAAVVLHIGGMVSPAADRYPEKTMKVNVGGTRNVVEAVKARPDRDSVRLVYIGSVAQTGWHEPPNHWGRAGEPLVPAEYDAYALSKIRAERVVAESGLKQWVSLRQTGILHPGLFLRSQEPITFHVPLRGVLEWATVEDSGRLMAAMCNDDIPDSFWRNFYNIGSGASYRLTNYEFECLILKAVGSPPPEKIFEPWWFALRNFHGCWFADSDRLEQLFHFRGNIPAERYIREMVRKAPLWVRLAPLAPAPLVKKIMKQVAETPGDGTLYWRDRTDCEEKIRAYFGSREAWNQIPGWDGFDLSRPSDTPAEMELGYDPEKRDEEIDLEDCRRVAERRGGRCLATEMPGSLWEPMEWEAPDGSRFTASPGLVLRGGHFHPI